MCSSRISTWAFAIATRRLCHICVTRELHKGDGICCCVVPVGQAHSLGRNESECVF
jgi:hypothetical protein